MVLCRNPRLGHTMIARTPSTDTPAASKIATATKIAADPSAAFGHARESLRAGKSVDAAAAREPLSSVPSPPVPLAVGLVFVTLGKRWWLERRGGKWQAHGCLNGGNRWQIVKSETNLSNFASI